MSELNLDIRRFTERYLAENGSVPEVRTIASALNLSEEEVIEALEVGGTVSLDQQVGGDEDGRTLGDLLPAQDSGFEQLELKETLTAAMDDFPELERQILQLRFIENLSQTEAALRLNVSQMTVSRMERKALAKLKERLKNLL